MTFDMPPQSAKSELNFSPACERNKVPILTVLKSELVDITEVWEVGSGTGQHAVFFAEELPHLMWQTTDLRKNHPDIQARVNDAQLPNLKPPLDLDVSLFPWPMQPVEAVFSANTLHIISQAAVQAFFNGIRQSLKNGGKLCVYGPFKYRGNFTSDSNEQFDRQLKQRDPASGIRDFEWINQLAQAADCCLQSDHEMPANNRLLVWKKDGSAVSSVDQ
jgi:cyclopropane fatty-acyl-phospholipid synthase-like methyltransferase